MFLGKNLSLVLMSVFVIMTVGCDDGNQIKTNALENVASSKNADDVLKKIYDDNQNTVYIKAMGTAHLEDYIVADLMLKKRHWQERNPEKKVVSMTAITGTGGLGRSVAIGLLIHYEKQ